MSLTVVKKKLRIMSTNSRESHKETNTIPKTDVPQSQSGFPVGLTSVSDRQELLLVYFQFFYSSFLLLVHQAAVLRGS